MILLAALAGAVGSLAFAPVEIWPAMPLSILGLLLLRPRRHAWRIGYAYGLGFFLPLLHWSGTYVGWFPWVALALLQAAFIAPVAVFIARIRQAHVLAFAVASAAAWTLQEAIRSRIPWGGFGWGRIAFSQVDAPYAPVVMLGGAPLLTFAVVFACALLARRAALHFAVTGVLLFVAVANAPSLSGVREIASVRVAVVQGNVPRLGLDFNAQRQAVLENHLRTSAAIARGSADLVVWPENASDIDPLDDPSVRSRIDRLVNGMRAPLILGAVLRDEGQLLNAAIAWRPESGAGERYIKRRLAPFGEFMPLRPLAERLVPEAKRVTDFTPGRQIVLFDVGPTARVGTLICFEVLYDDLGRDLVRAGANLLIAQTNSATFGTSPESQQQLQMTRLRAMEHRRAIASASTAGISAMVDPTGRVVAETAFFTSEVLTERLPVMQGQTPSDRFGGGIEWLLASLILVPLLRRRT
jgi:apolipoprotein N-acyltransferase